MAKKKKLKKLEQAYVLANDLKEKAKRTLRKQLKKLMKQLEPEREDYREARKKAKKARKDLEAAQGKKKAGKKKKNKKQKRDAVQAKMSITVKDAEQKSRSTSSKRSKRVSKPGKDAGEVKAKKVAGKVDLGPRENAKVEIKKTTSSPTPAPENKPRRRGRPPGSKNKPKTNVTATTQDNVTTTKSKTPSSTKKTTTGTNATTKRRSPGRPSKKRTPVKREGDDFTKIEGVGPAIEKLIYAAGIKTYDDMLKTDDDRLQQILTEGGNRYRAHKAVNWKVQVQMLRDGKLEELEAWQAEHKRGRK